MKTNDKKLLIIGNMPPPIGGVTIYVKRLTKWLRINKFKYIFSDIRRDSLLVTLIRILKAEVVHINLSRPIVILGLVVLSRLSFSKVIVTVHGNFGDKITISKIEFFLFNLAIKYSSLVLVLNKKSKEKAQSINDSTILISSYLPATTDEINELGLESIIDTIVASKNTVVSTNAFDLTFDQNRNEIYGISKLIIWAVKNNYLLVVSDPSSNYYSWIKKNFPTLLSPNVLFIPFQHNFMAVLKYVNFFIRNTTTDGDSVSIHEALASDVTVYATNCVSRPDNVIVYDDLDKVQLSPNKKLNSVEPSNSLHTMIDIYSKL
jgi:glycosyltransferase involved in cell wall biosynthesis